MAHQDLCRYVLLVLIFSIRSKWRKTVYVYLYVLLINQVFLICSFIILHRLAHLCFTQVVLNTRDFHKWIIASLNRLTHWKVGFQCLHIAAILIWMEIKVKFISSQVITGKDCYWLAPRCWENSTSSCIQNWFHITKIEKKTNWLVFWKYPTELLPHQKGY